MNLTLFGKEQHFQFQGAFDHFVKLALFPSQYDKADHVVIFAIYHNQLLFTRHKIRGIELPGGKIDKPESPLQAAIRELFEETGAHASSMWLVGQYRVYVSEEKFFTKNIYAATIDAIDPIHSGEDTHGYILLPLDASFDSHAEGISPLVLDFVFPLVRDNILPHASSAIDER